MSDDKAVRRIKELEKRLSAANGHVSFAETQIEELLDDMLEAAAEIERLREAIFWACGVNGTFRLREDGEGQFWWRKELRKLAGISGEELNRRALAEIEEVEE